MRRQHQIQARKTIILTWQHLQWVSGRCGVHLIITPCRKYVRELQRQCNQTIFTQTRLPTSAW